MLVANPDIARADSLEIAPAINKDITLNPGEKKKGFIDILNPSALSVRVTLDVKAYKQVDAEGLLQFIDNEQVAAGVILDLTEFDLGPKESARVYYLLDGTKLPQGAVFAAIFAQNNPSTGAATQAIRIGSLLSISNGTPVASTATISDISAQFLQIGSGLVVSAAVTNDSKDPKTTGVFPQISYDFWPYSSTKAEGPLVFNGVTRNVEYRRPGNFVGVVRVSVSAGSNQKSAYVIAVTGFWRWLLPAIVGAMVLAGIAVKIYRGGKAARR